MKKIYFLTILFISTLSIGQTTIFNAAGGGAYPNGSWMEENNVAGAIIDKVTYYHLEAGAPSDKIITSTYDLSAYASATLDIDVATFGSGGNNPALIEISYDGGSNYTESFSTATPTGSSPYIAGGPINLSTVSNQVKIRISNAGATGRGVRLRNIKLDAIGTDPQISITSPANAAIFNPVTTSVNVDLSVLNFDVAAFGLGDGHIHYTINAVAQPMKYDTTPIAVPVTAGNSYTVFVQLVDDLHNPIAPAVNATVNFSVAAITSVANILAVRADVIANGVGKYYQITGQALVSYARTSRNQKYIQDATAAILIDDNAGIITNPFVIGDGMTGLKGQTFDFNGVLEFVPIQNISASSSGNTITPQVVTAATISGNIEAYESKLVQINNAVFTTANGTLTFATGGPDGPDYNLNDGTGDINFRTMFAEANYIGLIVPSAAENVVVLVSENLGVARIVARSKTGLPLNTKSFDGISGLTMYPNPLTGNTLNIISANNTDISVAIFDMLGKQVLNSKVTNNTVKVSNLNAGIYIVKITEEGKTATRKLVVN